MLRDFEEVATDAAELVAAVNTSLLKGELDEALQIAVDAKAKSSGKAQAAAYRAICRVHCSGVGEAQEALQAADQAVAASKAAKDEAGEAAGLRQTAEAQLLAKNFQDAMKSAEDALSKFQSISHQVGEASATVTLAYVHLAQGRQQKGLETAEKAMDLFRRASERTGEAVALHAVLDSALAMKKYSQASAAADKMIEIFQGLDDTLGQGVAKLLSIEVHLANDDSREAAVTANEAAALLKASGATRRLAKALQLGAEAHMAIGPSEETVKMAERAQMIFQQLGDKSGQAAAMITAANIYNAFGEFDKAAYRAESAAETYRKLKATSDAAASMRTAALIFLDKKQYDPDAGMSVARDALRAAKTSKKLYEDAGEEGTAGYAGSLQSLAAAYLATEDYEKAMAEATASKELFLSLDHSVGAASALNTIAQVHHKKGDNFEAVSAAKDAQQLFRDGGDEQGAEVAAYLIETFEVVPEKEGEKAEGEEEEGKKGKKPKPAVVKSVSGLGDLVPGNPGAVTFLAAYDAYEGRAATTPGQRRQASDRAAGAMEDFQGPTTSPAVFNLRWLPAKPRPEAEPPSKRAAKRIANKVVRMHIASGGENAPNGILPVVERDLTALD